MVADLGGTASHRIIEQGLEALANLGHRGACGCDPETGDGAGIMLRMPHEFMASAAAAAKVKIPFNGSLRSRDGLSAAVR